MKRTKRLKKGSRLLLAAALMPAILPAPLQAEEISDVFKRVRDSVVVIETEEREVSPLQRDKFVTVGGLGSGVLVDSLGIVLTAAHVVQAAEKVQVHFANGDVYDAQVYASAPFADVAAVKLARPPKGGVVATLGDSDAAEVGEEIFIVGAPLGISYTLTVGHISARREANQIWGGLSQAEMLQTDAAINHGNSGGPMFNKRGEVIGIVSSMISQSGGYEGLGFVITSNLARELVLEERSLWSGLELYALEGELAAAFNLPQNLGLLVQRVADGSPASRLGLRHGTIHAAIEEEELLLGGDVILGMNGIRVSEEGALEKIRRQLNGIVPGEVVTVTILRDGSVMDVKGAVVEP